MLGKLTKYEIKATARIFLPLYLVLVAFAVINKLFTLVKSEGFIVIPQGLAMMGYVFIIISIFALTFFVMIQRFYKNLLSDEGYLMNTLPVKSWQLIISKALVSIMWLVVSFAATIFSVFVLASSKDLIDNIKIMIPELWSQLNLMFDGKAWLLTLEFIFFALISMCVYIFMIYASISIGHQFSKHRILGSFGAYLIFYTISQIIVVTGMFVIGGLDIVEKLETLPPYEFVPMLFLCIMIYNLAMSIIYFLISKYILSKRLNLE